MSSKPRRKRRFSPIQRFFTQVSDPRSKQGRRHSLPSILALVFAATAAGAKGPIGIAEYGRQLPPRAQKKLGVRKDKVTGVYTSPSANTIRSAVTALDAVELTELLCQALKVDRAVAVLSVDGKTLRGSRRHNQKAKAVLSALDVTTGLVLAQREISEEHLEIPEFRPLLQPLDLTGVVVTADAMHTQIAHARFLVEEKGADFLFVVKQNQGGLFGELNRWNRDRFQPPVTTVDKGHGRIETRTIEVSEVGERYLPFPHVKQIFKIHRKSLIVVSGETREEICFGITSLSPDQANSERLQEMARSHWAIENELHWVKDQSMGEDASQVRIGAAAFSLLRSQVLGLLRQAGYTNIAKALRELAWDWRRAFALVGV